MHKHLMICSVSVVLAASACASSQAEQVKDARMEQAEARADANENNVEQQSEARDDSLDQAYDIRKDIIASANQPGDDANADLNEVSKERAQYQSQAATRVQKLGVRIDEAAKKIKVLGNRAPVDLASQLKTAATEYGMLKQEVDKLETTPTTDWESKTSDLDNRMSALDSRIQDLKASIEDV
jgi:chromosome segregation ATPase